MPLSQADLRVIDRVVELLRTARRLLFITGAGLSADSGLPTYRGVGGLYAAGRTTPYGLPVEEVLSGAMMTTRPEITWQFILELERPTRLAVPNRGHQVIAEMESHFDTILTLTQNVDGLHRRAGSRQVLDVHGDLHDLACTRCEHTKRVSDYDGLDLPPRCPKCQGILRPLRRPVRRGAAGDEDGPVVVGGPGGVRRGLQHRHEQLVPLHRRAGAEGARDGDPDGGDQPGVDGCDAPS
jgi:NAD-dependent deacetylase